jgi:hypothetical protein
MEARIVQGSVSMNYSGSRTSQMLAELVLPFSVLCFCSLKRGQKKKKRIKKEKSAFQMGGSGSCCSVVPGLLGCYVL